LNFFFLIGSLLFLIGCATPAQRFEQTAIENGFVTQKVIGLSFEHLIYSNHQSVQTTPVTTLHVYLDGDGTPQDKDPTSRNALILTLMAQDTSPSILLGRPCYHQMEPTQQCHQRLWTSARYSSTVVNSMVVALRHWLEKHPAHTITLIGFSGGGTLAVLMADKIPTVKTVLTLAANLDTEGWTKEHGYQPLSDSLNPMTQQKLPDYIKQIHLAGAKDGNVLPAFIKAYAEQQQAQYKVFAKFDHHCCWADIWTKILQGL
jgi:Alpha/beta hydrolase domain containing 18